MPSIERVVPWTESLDALIEAGADQVDAAMDPSGGDRQAMLRSGRRDRGGLAARRGEICGRTRRVAGRRRLRAGGLVVTDSLVGLLRHQLLEANDDRERDRECEQEAFHVHRRVVSISVVGLGGRVTRSARGRDRRDGTGCSA